MGGRPFTWDFRRWTQLGFREIPCFFFLLGVQPFSFSGNVFLFRKEQTPCSKKIMMVKANKSRSWQNRKSLDIFDLPRSQKWRFTLGFPTKNVIILVVNPSIFPFYRGQVQPFPTRISLKSASGKANISSNSAWPRGCLSDGRTWSLYEKISSTLR